MTLADARTPGWQPQHLTLYAIMVPVAAATWFKFKRDEPDADGVRYSRRCPDRGGARRPISVLHVERIGDDAAETHGVPSDGRLGTPAVCLRSSGLRLAQWCRPFAFSADGARYQLAMEAQASGSPTCSIPCSSP
ncbi:MAG: hypothetical protein U1E52_02115 [Geminicoccaceae bacterium]